VKRFIVKCPNVIQPVIEEVKELKSEQGDG
jgi:hypothetical protein